MNKDKIKLSYGEKVEKALNRAKDLLGNKRNMKIEIFPSTGEMRLAWENPDGKRKSSRLDNLFKSIEAILPIKSVIPQSRNAKQSFYGMETRPKTKQNPPDVAGAEMALFLETIVNPDLDKQQNFENTHYGEYRVLIGTTTKAYYNKNGNLVFIRDENGKEYWVNQEYPELNTERFQQCEICEGYFPGDKINLYATKLGENKHLCNHCKGDNHEIVIK